MLRRARSSSMSKASSKPRRFSSSVSGSRFANWASRSIVPTSAVAEERHHQPADRQRAHRGQPAVHLRVAGGLEREHDRVAGRHQRHVHQRRPQPEEVEDEDRDPEERERRVGVARAPGVHGGARQRRAEQRDQVEPGDGQAIAGRDTSASASAAVSTETITSRSSSWTAASGVAAEISPKRAPSRQNRAPVRAVRARTPGASPPQVESRKRIRSRKGGSKCPPIDRVGWPPVTAAAGVLVWPL